MYEDEQGKIQPPFERADISSNQFLTDLKRYEKIRTLVKEWASKQGHESCWYYPEIFRQIAALVEVEVEPPSLPTPEAFKDGCCRYQEEIYSKDKENDNCSPNR